MLHRLFGIASAVSLLLCLACVVEWVSSLRVHFEDSTMPGPDLYIVPSHPFWGVIALVFLIISSACLAAGYLTSPADSTPPNNRGRCTRCGYNLTGNTSGVCPECGTPVSNKPEAVA